MSARNLTPENVKKTSIKNLAIEEKQRLIDEARAAGAKPGEQEFWKEVQDRMDIRDQQVTPRPKKGH